MRSKSRATSRPSSWAVGSSRMMKRVPCSSARAISTIWRCSTLRSRASCVTSISRPHSSSTCRARRRSVAQLIQPPEVGWALRKRFSATVSVGITVERW